MLLLLLLSGTVGAVEALEDSAHAWAAGDVFSLHGVDQYQYIIVYSRDTADGRVHGCYEVQQEPSGRYVVPTYVHGQEVFPGTFIAEQGGRFLANVPLDQVVITDDTPVDGGRTYFGVTLGSIYGGGPTPTPTATPAGPATVPGWPSLAPTPPAGTPAPVTTQAPVQAPVDNPDTIPYPLPTVTQGGAPVGPTEPLLPSPTPTQTVLPDTVGPSPDPTPEPSVTSAPSPSRVWGKRLATWQAPSVKARRAPAEVSPAGTESTTGAKPAGTATRFGRTYPRWSRVGAVAA